MYYLQGGVSCRLGNDSVTGQLAGNPPAFAERIQYNYIPNLTNCLFTYQYAVVLHNPEHNDEEQPIFTIHVLVDGVQIPDTICGKYKVVSKPNLKGWHSNSPRSGLMNQDDQVWWKDWSAVTLDLSPYIGKNISVEFTTYDCSRGGHFGYAYLNCYCGSLELSQVCSGVSNSLMSAPAGFESYSWSPSGETTSSIVIAPTFPDTVKVTCINTNGCEVVFKGHPNVISADFTLSPPTEFCAGDNTESTFLATGLASNMYTWSELGVQCHL